MNCACVKAKKQCVSCLALRKSCCFNMNLLSAMLNLLLLFLLQIQDNHLSQSCDLPTMPSMALPLPMIN